MFRRATLTAALLGALSTPVSAQAGYTDVYFFGTSELDTGNWLLNASLAGNALAPTAAKGFYNGRWQSGPAWSDYFAWSLGFSAAPSLSGGKNYAFGVGWLGPLTGESAPPAGTLRANEALWFRSQVNAALAAHPQGLPPSALYVVSIGFNDVSFFGRTPDQAGAVAALAVSEVRRLVNAGARSFLVQTLGGTDAFVTTYNSALLAGLAGIPEINLSVLDTRTFTQTVLLAPGFLASIGITSFGSCLSDPVCQSAAIAKTTAGEAYLESQYLTFDGVHRDPKVSRAFAEYAITRLPQVVPEPGTVWLLAGGLVGLGVMRRRKRREPPRGSRPVGTGRTGC
jgi:phospholipase/lecithinase/hemolysin